MSHPTPPKHHDKPGQPPVKPPTPEQVAAAAAASGPAPAGPSVPLPTSPAGESKPDLCGLPHEYKTTKGETKTKPCVKARGHSGPHSSRQQGPKVDLSVLAEIALEMEDVETSELLDVVTERVRDKQQLAVDADVALAHRKWVQAGKPVGVNEAIRKGAASRYTVAPEQVAAIRTLLRRTENAPELKGKVHVKIPPAKSHTSGKSMVYFIVVDKAKKPETAKK